MERNRMDEEFKSKLNQREIRPSEHAWARLDAMLNESEDKKVVPLRKLNWLYIAAGFGGLLLVATMFFKGAETNQIPEVVIEDVKNNQHDANQKPLDSVNDVKHLQVVPEKNTQVAENQAENKNLDGAAQKVVTPQNRSHKTSSPIQQNHNNTSVASLEKRNPNARDRQPSTDKIINQPIPKGESYLSERNKINPVNAVADEQMASIEPQLTNAKTVKVDPNSLLSQVDGELELSFREKVIQLANKKYQNVKVALANRNNE